MSLTKKEQLGNIVQNILHENHYRKGGPSCANCNYYSFSWDDERSECKLLNDAVGRISEERGIMNWWSYTMLDVDPGFVCDKWERKNEIN